MDYKGIFRYFSEISKIPRSSGNEEEISEYLVSFYEIQGLEYNRDAANNVIIIKEASPGYETEPAIMHKVIWIWSVNRPRMAVMIFLGWNKASDRWNFLHADGTTLGADNGIAAYMMALLSDDELKHPRIEAAITSDEEVGMNGAKALDLSSMRRIHD